MADDENLSDGMFDENWEGWFDWYGLRLVPIDDTYYVGVRFDTSAAIVLQDAGNGEVTQPYPNGGFGAVPASAAAVSCLEKQTFRAGEKDGGGETEGSCGITECSVCFEEFVDGVQVSVMPCPSSRQHRFHQECIAKWLGISNMCPLCRHELPVVFAYPG